LHDVTTHAPALHPAVPFVVVQTFPHAPQLLMSAETGFSQPLPAMPSQLPHPVLHDANVHVPVEQSPLAFGYEQLTPHPPQLFVVFSGCSQPSM
jgi:hypothetical protein